MQLLAWVDWWQHRLQALTRALVCAAEPVCGVQGLSCSSIPAWCTTEPLKPAAASPWGGLKLGCSRNPCRGRFLPRGWGWGSSQGVSHSSIPGPAAELQGAVLSSVSFVFFFFCQINRWVVCAIFSVLNYSASP